MIYIYFLLTVSLDSNLKPQNPNYDNHAILVALAGLIGPEGKNLGGTQEVHG